MTDQMLFKIYISTNGSTYWGKWVVDSQHQLLEGQSAENPETRLQINIEWYVILRFAFCSYRKHGPLMTHATTFPHYRASGV